MRVSNRLRIHWPVELSRVMQAFEGSRRVYKAKCCHRIEILTDAVLGRPSLRSNVLFFRIPGSCQRERAVRMREQVNQVVKHRWSNSVFCILDGLARLIMQKGYVWESLDASR